MIPLIKKNKNLKVCIIFIVILFVAFFFRFYNIQSTPPGLYPDEAINGNDALKVLENGDFKIFYNDNNGREGLLINIQASFLKLFGPHPWTLRLPSAVFGFLTVIGLYLLVRQLFNWQIASLSSFYLAISFWHINFSRIGFRGILVPFLMVFAFYFLWRGIKTIKLWPYLVSGIFFGLGFHTYIGFRFVPFVVLFMLLVYWQKIKKDYSHEDYEHFRNKLAKGLAMLLLATIIVALPIGYYFWTHQGDFFGRGSQVSIFAAENPFIEFLKSSVKTLGMFNFIGDFNWRHNFSGSPQLLWPIGVFFFIGLVRSFIKCVRMKKKHGHFSTIHTLTLSWFIIMLLPAILTGESPHALRSIGVIPVVMLFAGEGTWWIFEILKNWYRMHDYHLNENLHTKEMEATKIVGLILVIFLASLAFFNYDKYFNKWTNRPGVQDAFSVKFVELGEKLNAINKNIPKYVVVNEPGVKVETYNPFNGKMRGIPMPAQTVMFTTQTYTEQLQKEKNLFYILPGEETKIKIRDAKVFKLLQK